MARLSDVAVGDSVKFVSPIGEKIAVARTGPREDAADFVALSSTCPHLGCQVFWEPQPGRFYCPCHKGSFDPEGRPTGGPPLEAGTPLMQYRLEVRRGLLFVHVPIERLTGARSQP